MGAAHGAMLHAIRQEADRLEGVSEGRFRSLRALDGSGVSEKLVLAAAARGREGDQDALRLLYLRYADNVYGYVCSLVHDEHEAEDVTQQLFASLRNRLGRYEPRAAPFSSWILRVAHNAAIDHVRARRPLLCEEVRGGDEACEESHQQSRDLREALDSLPEDQRLVIVMRFVLGLSPAEVAARIGRSEDAVHGLQHRGRRSLRAALERLDAAPVTLTPRTAIPERALATAKLTE
jgi:RNA polymerase sigma-70 factor (ECF subfamily)